MKTISLEKAKETHDKLREILIEHNCAEYGDCIVDEISRLFNFPTTIDTDPEDDNFDADELKSNFNEHLYKKGFSFEEVTSFSDEHFENLLSFEKNEKNFMKFNTP